MDPDSNDPDGQRRAAQRRANARAAALREEADFIAEIVETAACIGAAKTHSGVQVVRTDAVWRLLVALERSTYCNAISDAARLLRISRQSAHELASKAQRQGLLELAPNHDDRRIVQLLLTPAARSALAAARSTERLWRAQLLLGLDSRQMRSTAHILRVIRHRLLRNERVAKETKR